MQHINFEPLRTISGHSIFNMDAYKPIRVRTARKWLKIIVLLVVGFLLALTMIGIVVAGLVYLVFLVVRSRKLNIVQKQFAASNNWELSATEIIPKDTMLPLQLEVNNFTGYVRGGIIHGQLQQQDFWLYKYQISRLFPRVPETYVSVVLTVRVKANLPITFLDSLSDGTAAMPYLSSNLGLQKISLEGMFNKAFYVTAAPDDEINALVLYTPDMMELVVQEGTFINVETGGEFVHFLSYVKPAFGYKHTKHLFEFAQKYLHKARLM